MEKFLTIFTPTYNRRKYLTRLYESLLAQKSYNFEWLIIDDGSEDGTEELIKSFQDAPFPIRYFYFPNAGLNRSINRGLDRANGELFLKLDSDDYLLENTLVEIEKNYPKIKNNDNLCAIVFNIIDQNQNLIGHHPFKSDTEASFFEYRFKYGGKGDRIEVIKTDVHKKYRAMEIEGERFAPDSVFFYSMSEKYKALYINKTIYVREYLDEGMTKSSVFNTLKNNPKGHLYIMSKILKMKPNLMSYIKFSILYFRFSSYTKQTLLEQIKNVPLNAFIIGFIPGKVIYLLDKIEPDFYKKLLFINKK